MSLVKYTLKEDKLHIRKVSVIDIEEVADEPDVKFAIENKETKVIFKAETPEDKRSWMAVLVMLNTKSMLERTLDNYLEKEVGPLAYDPSSLIDRSTLSNLSSETSMAKQNCAIDHFN